MAGKLIGWLISLAMFGGLGYFLFTKAQFQMLSFNAWGTLQTQYGVAQMPPAFDLTSGTVGMFRYRNMLRVALTDTGVYLAPGIGISRKPVFIPYRELRQDTSRHSFAVDFYTYTLFKAADTYIALDQPIARKIIDRQARLNQP